MKKLNTYQLRKAVENVILDIKNWNKRNALDEAFASFCPPDGVFYITSTAGESDTPVEVSYEADSDGDACNVRVWGTQGEVTDYLHGNDLSRIEEECNLYITGALIERSNESKIDAYLANQE